MPDVDVPLLILAQPMGVAPYQSLRRNEPVMHTLVGMHSGTDNWRSIARLVGDLKVERRRQCGSQNGAGTRCQEGSASLFLHGRTLSSKFNAPRRYHPLNSK